MKDMSKDYYYPLFTQTDLVQSDENFVLFKHDVEASYCERLVSFAYSALEKESERQEFDDFLMWRDNHPQKLIDFMKKLHPKFSEEVLVMEKDFLNEYQHSLDSEFDDLDYFEG